MRAGNLHEPQTGVDVTKIPSEGQTETLRRIGDTISLFYTSDTWTMTEEMKKKLQTTQRRMLGTVSTLVRLHHGLVPGLSNTCVKQLVNKPPATSVEDANLLRTLPQFP